MLKIIEEEHGAVRPEDIAMIIDATEIVDIRVADINAGPLRFSDPEEVHVRLAREEPSFATSNDGKLLQVRLPHTLQCAASDSPGEDEIDTISVSHLVTFDVTKDLEVTGARIAAFIETNVYFLVYPYIRQLFTLLTTEFGLPPVVLGYLKRDEWPYDSSDD